MESVRIEHTRFKDKFVFNPYLLSRGDIMGKAAERRKSYRLKYLAKLSFEDPTQFASQWEIRLQSWLDEVRAISEGSLRS